MIIVLKRNATKEKIEELKEQLQKDTKYIYKVYLQNNKIYDTINK